MLRIVNIDTAPPESMGERGRTIKIVNTTMGAKRLDVHVNMLKVGDPGGKYHYHSEAENIYVVLRGIGTMVVDGKEYQIRPHDVVFIPPKAKHSLTNKGKEELVLVEVYAPPDPDFTVVSA